MTTDADITVLGASGTGKTCFLYAMAHEFMEELCGCDGFVVQTVKQGPINGQWCRDEEARTKLIEGWHEIERGRNPDTTSSSVGEEIYTFELLQVNRPILRFNWIDYRGGLLTDETEQLEHAMIVERLKRSKSVVVCLPADEIINNTEDLKRLARVYQNALLDTRTPLSLCLMVCKKDLCPGRANYDRCVQALRGRLFSNYLGTGNDKEVAIVPVQLGDNFRNLGKESVRDEERCRIRPMNIQFPIFYSAYVSLETKRQELEKTKNDLFLEIQRKRTNQSVWSTISRAVGYQDNWIYNKEKEIKRCQDEIASIDNSIELLKNPIRELNRQARSGRSIVQIFKGGQEILI